MPKASDTPTFEDVVDKVTAIFDLLEENFTAMAQAQEPQKKFLVTKTDILSKDDLKVEELYVPEWDGWVRVRTINASERDWFESTTVQRNGSVITTNLRNIRARLCLLCLVDENGERIFREEDEFPLGGKSAAALDRIFTVAQRLNGLREDDVKDLAKNLPADQGDASPSV